MNDAVDDRYGDVVVVEVVGPVGELLVSGQDDGAVLVQGVDQLEQVVAGLAGHRQVAEFIDDEHVELREVGDLLLQFPTELSQLQGLDQPQGGGEQGPDAGTAQPGAPLAFEPARGVTGGRKLFEQVAYLE